MLLIVNYVTLLHYICLTDSVTVTLQMKHVHNKVYDELIKYDKLQKIKADVSTHLAFDPKIFLVYKVVQIN